MSGAEPVGTRVRRRRWLFVAGGSLALLVVGKMVLGFLVGFHRALRWALVACPLLVYEAWFFHSRRGHATLGVAIRVADAVTLVRGWLFAAVAGFVALQPLPRIAWLPGVCYGVGVALDHADGRIARQTGGETRLGEQLDMAFDTLGFLVAPVVAVAWGRLPVWYLSLAVARYLFKLGRGLRRWRDKPVYDLPPSERRRQLSGLQMTFLTVALLPVVPAEPLAAVAAVVLAPSLAVFVRDYLVVAGHYRPTSEG